MWSACNAGRPVSGKPRPAGYSSSTPSMRGTLAGSSSSSPKPGASLPGRHSSPYSPSAAAAAAAGRPSWDGAANVQYGSESLHSTLSAEAGARSPGGAAVQGEPGFHGSSFCREPWHHACIICDMPTKTDSTIRQCTCRYQVFYAVVECRH